jgi:transcriptional regulator with GAF, ATPase, and Fis domain
MTLDPNENIPLDSSVPISADPSGFVKSSKTKTSQGSDPTDTPAENQMESPAEVSTEIPKRFEKKPTAETMASPDSKLVDQTKNQIRVLVQEIADLAKTDCSVEDFYEGFLTRTTSALASIGGAIWVRENTDAPLKLHYHINLKKTKLAKDKKAQATHGRLLQKLADQGEPVLIGPNSGLGNDTESEPQSSTDLPGNPTEYLLVVGPLKIDNQTIGLVEIFQRSGAGPTTQRGYLRFLTQMCDIASDFLRNQRIRSFSEQQKVWQQLEQFIRLVHQGLDPEQTVFTIANEGRRLIDCDRVSVAIGKGRQCRVRAVSGLDSIERRSEQVKNLNSLSRSVIKTGQPLWYTGDEELPPQIEKKIHAYVDKSHTRMLAIVPLFETANEPETPGQPAPKRSPLGALIIEQLKDARVTPALKNRVNVVVEHGETALTNADEHHGIFMMPVWKSLGKITGAFRGENLGRSLMIMAAIAGVLAFLAMFPYPFGLGAKGSLIPETQSEVFAKIDGTIEELFVNDDGNTDVKADQILARMTNSDIALAISGLSGRIAEAKSEITSNSFILSDNGREKLEPYERVEIEGKVRTAEQMVSSLNDELAIRLEEQRQLNIKSPSDGRVINWNLRQNLMHRPVLAGQKLMTIVHPDTEWLIELEMPERRLHHLIQAQRKSKELTVTFGLVSNPGTEYEGTLISIDKKLDVHSDEGNTALVRVAFTNEDIDPGLLRSETRVTAKVQCGTRSIGYVMFHELFETVQSTWMFWF